MRCVSTPLQLVSGIWVKREDLCSPPPGPPFSKMRGVLARISSRPEQTIGVLDTYHSMAGWAVAYACSLLGKRCVNFWPRYLRDGKMLRESQRQSQSLGAQLVAFPAGRSAILYHRAKAWLRDNEPGAYLMPNALKLEETVTETAAEVSRTRAPLGVDTWVISASSGTIAAGVLLGMEQVAAESRAIVHLGYSRSEDALRKYISSYGVTREYTVIDQGYAYSDRAPRWASAPFPCNPYYDLKAWEWLTAVSPYRNSKCQILFWNIGA